MLIRDKKYPSRYIPDYKGYEIQFKNHLADVPDKVSAELIATGDYELVSSVHNDQPTPIPSNKFGFKASSWRDERKLVFDTAIGFANGYGKSGMMIAEALSDHVDTYVMNNKWVGYSPEHVSDKLNKLIQKRLETIDTFYVQYWPAFNFRPIAKRQVGYTMLECSKIPQSWVDAINNSLERCIVPGEYLVDVFKNCGVEVDLKSIPLGIIPEMFPYIERERKDDDFVFGIMGTLTHRKGADIAVKAFRKAFPAKKYPNVGLYIKTLPVQGLVGGFLSREDLQDERIILNTETFSPQGLLDHFFAKVDAFVFPTRGEGFGMPPVEAMATGLPTIVTDYSACTEYTNKKYNYPLEYKIADVPNGTPGGYPPDLQAEGQQWAEPDEDHLVYLMRYIVENREIAKRKGKRASKWVKENFSADLTAKRIVDYLDEKL